jgi:hypothetical protein
LIPLLSSLGLGLAMTSDTSSEQPYPAKIIVGWEDGARIERPLPLSKAGIRGTVYDPYLNLTGIFLPHDVYYRSHSIVYRVADCKPGYDNVHDIISFQRSLNDPIMRIEIEESITNVAMSDPVKARILWFLRHIGMFPGHQDDEKFDLPLRILLRLGIPEHRSSLLIDQWSRSWEEEFEIYSHWSMGEQAENFRSKIARTLRDFFNTRGLHDFAWTTNIEKYDRLLLSPISDRQNEYTPEVLNTILQEGKQLYLRSLAPSFFPVQPLYWFPFGENPVKFMLKRKILETTEDHIERMKAIFELGEPDYMDGYETMATLIDRSDSLARISEDQFGGMFGVMDPSGEFR